MALRRQGEHAAVPQLFRRGAAAVWWHGLSAASSSSIRNGRTSWPSISRGASFSGTRQPTSLRCILPTRWCARPYRLAGESAGDELLLLRGRDAAAERVGYSAGTWTCGAASACRCWSESACPAATARTPRPGNMPARGDAHASATWSRAVQQSWAARYVPLLLAKPCIQGIFWNQFEDAMPHDFPHAGLITANGHAKPALDTLARLRRRSSIRGRWVGLPNQGNTRSRNNGGSPARRSEQYGKPRLQCPAKMPVEPANSRPLQARRPRTDLGNCCRRTSIERTRALEQVRHGQGGASNGCHAKIEHSRGRLHATLYKGESDRNRGRGHKETLGFLRLSRTFASAARDEHCDMRIQRATSCPMGA